MTLSTEKPRIQRVYVTALDPDTKKSQSVTLYGATPEQVIEKLRSDAAKDKRKQASPSAA